MNNEQLIIVQHPVTLIESHMKEKDTTLNILAHAFRDKESMTKMSNADFLYHLKNYGFSAEHIDSATTWIAQLMQQQFATPTALPAATSLRIFTPEEMAKLDVTCRNFILYLDHLQILETKTREMVINQVLLLNQDTISTNDIKLVTLIVLLLQPASDEKIKKLERFALTAGTKTY